MDYMDFNPIRYSVNVLQVYLYLTMRVSLVSIAYTMPLKLLVPGHSTC